MNWNNDNLNKAALDAKQREFIRQALEMARRAPVQQTSVKQSDTSFSEEFTTFAGEQAETSSESIASVTKQPENAEAPQEEKKESFFTEEVPLQKTPCNCPACQQRRAREQKK